MDKFQLMHKISLYLDLVLNVMNDANHGHCGMKNPNAGLEFIVLKLELKFRVPIQVKEKVEGL